MIRWREAYGCYSAKVGAFGLGVNASMDRNKPGYRVSFNGVSAPKYASSIGEGQAQAIEMARTALKQALEQLEEADV